MQIWGCQVAQVPLASPQCPFLLPPGPRLHRMGLPVSWAPPALWVLGCCALLLWLWALCTACRRPEDAVSPRKRARRQRARLQGSATAAEASMLRRTHLCSLSKSDTRLHELHRGPRGSRALRPASMDLLRPHRLEVFRDITGPQAAPSAFPHQKLPRAVPAAAATAGCAGLDATYSNVRLAALPGVSLAASPVVAEYARVQKRKGTHGSPQEPQQGKAEVTPAAQVDVLYSRVCKPKRRDPGPTTDPLDPKGHGAILALASDPAYQTLPLRALDVDSGPLENVYESIQELGDPAGRSSTCRTRTPPASSCPSLGRGWRPSPPSTLKDLCSFLQSEARPQPRPASQLTAPVPGPRAASP
ncbi:lck-interacting transmembrane adapter 1 isoform X2 [Nomascus leucogenys]|uniref:lck-interacting transmembrane adapter 1 isoform X2 n=2 Tax=Nomascus leucogenys TaxID=61853 RepID=UPI00122D74D9|nr:lck-interacting transmembrane adapter 1 isoform X2 [Nomascus leucogenys]